MPQTRPEPPAVDLDALRQLPIWVRRYAQHRTLPFIFSMLVFVAGSIVFAGLGLLVALAYRAGNMPGLIAALIVTAAFTIFWVWLSIIGMRQLSAAMNARLYRSEGEVQTAPDEDKSPLPTIHKVFVAVPLLLIGVTFWLLADRVDIRYMQPLTALWAVPFLVALWLRSRSSMGPIVLLWPALYALHAALTMLGAPIVFTGPLQGLNVFLPVAGYGLLTGLIGHLYSRYALARIHRLARAGGGEGE